MYPYLPKGYTIDYVSANNPFMKEATKLLDNAGCFAHPTSGVIVKDNNIIGRGTNAGILNDHCPRRDVHRHPEIKYPTEKGFPTGTGYHLCKRFCKQFGHSEPNALYNTLKGMGANDEELRPLTDLIDRMYYTEGHTINHSDKEDIKKYFSSMKIKGYDIEGFDFYHDGHWWMCEQCWSFLIAAGINKAYLREDSMELYKR